MNDLNCKTYNSHDGMLIVSRISRLMIIAVVVVFLCGLLGAGASSAAPVVKKAGSPIVEKCKLDLAKRLNVKVNLIKVASMKATTWSDAALGMPKIGGMYAQKMTPGSQVILECKNTRYLYVTSAKAFRYGGPVDIWNFSFLYSKPVANEPNLNGDLYQCSLLGTNSVRITTGVSDFYPQDKGVVIFKRRTSRSGHELLYLKANSPGNVKSLFSAFDFGAAAFNDKHDQWAGFVRPVLGDEWTVVVGSIGEDTTKMQTLALPAGVLPGSIAWSGEKVLILTSKQEQTTCFEATPGADTSGWKVANVQAFPGMDDYMLNKSERLEISQISKNGEWSVEVARVWFTEDRNLIARLDDFQLRGNKFLGRRFVYVWGERDTKPAICTVDIATGEVIPFTGGVSGVKPFLYPLRSSPIGLFKGK